MSSQQLQTGNEKKKCCDDVSKNDAILNDHHGSSFLENRVYGKAWLMMLYWEVQPQDSRKGREKGSTFTVHLISSTEIKQVIGLKKTWEAAFKCRFWMALVFPWSKVSDCTCSGGRMAGPGLCSWGLAEQGSHSGWTPELMAPTFLQTGSTGLLEKYLPRITIPALEEAEIVAWESLVLCLKANEQINPNNV